MPSTGTCAGDVSATLVAWQDSGDERWLESLVATTIDEFQHVATAVLRRHGNHDRSAVDDALSLVFDHLRRLRGTESGEHAVARFDAARILNRTPGDAGRAFLAWLVRERSLDVVRQRRRLAKHQRPFTDQRISHPRWNDSWAEWEEEHERWAHFHAAITRLEPRLRNVVEMLLAGKSQAAIAHVLDVCEGTVSRMRAKAIAELKRMMDP